MALPSKLSNEPLIDAIFECRFSALHPATSVLPGLLFGALPGKKTTQRLPTFDIPEPIRNTDPNLHYAPLLRIDWEQFWIMIGDRSLSVASKIPYVGWKVFKPAILTVIHTSVPSEVIDVVERFSLKYVDLLPKELGSPSELVDLELRVGPHSVVDATHFQIRSEFTETGIIHIIQLASSASVSSPGSATREGIIIDIDSIAAAQTKFPEFAANLDRELDHVHKENKRVFFSCLTPNALQKLGPIYE